jgi:hypothetical protein
MRTEFMLTALGFSSPALFAPPPFSTGSGSATGDTSAGGVGGAGAAAAAAASGFGAMLSYLT